MNLFIYVDNSVDSAKINAVVVYRCSMIINQSDKNISGSRTKTEGTQRLKEENQKHEIPTKTNANIHNDRLFDNNCHFKKIKVS